MPKYNNTDIPQKLWDFFESEPGLSTEQLTQAIDKRLIINPFYNFNFSYGMICKFKGGYDLVKYYRDHPKLSVDELLQYDAYAIRDFAVDDKHFKFHDWLFKHDLTIPFNLTRDGWGKISDLCNESGIEYLNRKILSVSIDERQNVLNQLAKTDSCAVERDIQHVLSDVLVPKHEVSWNTVEDRFKAFREKELKREVSLANKHTAGGMHSLFWISAKAVVKFKLETELLNDECISAVDDAKSLKFL